MLHSALFFFEDLKCTLVRSKTNELIPYKGLCFSILRLFLISLPYLFCIKRNSGI